MSLLTYKDAMDKMQIKDKDQKLMMTTLLIGGFLTTLATSTVNIALPNLISTFHTSLNTAKWALTGFMLTTGIIAPITCFLGEKFTYKRMYLISILGFTFSSLGCAFSLNIQMLIFFRILQGLFNGLAIPTSMSLIYQLIPRKKQAFAISLWSFALTFAPAIGPTLSGWLIQSFSWKAIFIVNIPLGIITSFLILKAIPSYKLNPPAGFDLFGFVTSIIATTLLLIAFSNISIWGWLSLKTILFIIAGVLFFTIFIHRELTTEDPILDLRVFKIETFSVSIIIRAVVTMSLYAGSLLTPLFLQNAQHSSALDAGLVLLPASVAMAITTIIVGGIYNKINPTILIRSGIVSIAIGSFLLSRTSLQTSHLYIMGSLVFRNVGIAMTMGTVTMFGMGSLEKKVSGNGSSINNWVAQSLGCFSIGIFTSLLSSQAKRHAAQIANYATASMDKTTIADTAFVMGINDVYLISAIIVLAALVLSFLYKKKSFADDREKNWKASL